MALPVTTKLTPRAEDIVRYANRQFEDVVSEAEAKAFDTATLDEVKQAARHLERTLDEKGDMPNMARLRDFYSGAEQYEQLCGKMDRNVVHLSWIWVRSLCRRWGPRPVLICSRLPWSPCFRQADLLRS